MADTATSDGYATQVFKIVVTGPFSAGKTALISEISEIPVVLTEVSTTDASEVAVKGSTTVSMDFGKFTVGGDPPIELLLFGTPGQSRFRFMWDVLARGADAKLLVVDASDRTTWSDAAAMARHFSGLGDAPFVVAANRAHDGGTHVDELRATLGVDPTTPVVPCQLVEPDSVRNLLTEVLIRVLECLDDGPVDDLALDEVGPDEAAAIGDH
ncbi:MAG: ATP/GTP-binding protein [Actinomycetota bacterium]|nr:ATP/GTP-binding protein [Actinomycetota bacterium]